MALIELTAGSDERVLFEFFEEDETGARLDLTGYTVTVGDGSDIVPVPSITDAMNGEVTVFFADTLLGSMALVSPYRFRLKFTTADDPDADIGTPEFTVVVS